MDSGVSGPPRITNISTSECCFSLAWNFSIDGKHWNASCAVSRVIDLESSKAEYESLFPSHAGMLVLSCPQDSMPDLLPATYMSQL